MKYLRIFVGIGVLQFLTSLTWAALTSKTIEYTSSGKTFEGYVAYDDSIKELRPGLLVAHDWLGLTDKTKAKADKLAQLGYVVLAVDIYGKGIRPKPNDAPAIAGTYKKDRVLLRNRMLAGLKTLRDQPGVDKRRIAALGYCFGGTAAIELGREGADIKSIVSFHGGLDSPKPEDGEKIKAKILVLHGADDPFVTASDLAAFEDEMRKSRLDWQLVKYGGVVHSFTDKTAGSDNSKGAAYNERADKRSWEAMHSFLKETL